MLTSTCCSVLILRGNLHEINEYLEEQGVYDIFDYLLKARATTQIPCRFKAQTLFRTL